MLKILTSACAVSLCALGVQAATISVSTFDSAAYNGSYGAGSLASEDFEALGSAAGDSEVGAALDTAVGTFSSYGGTGSGGTVTQLPGNTGEELALRSGDVFGRTNTTPLDGSWFLDSNDTFGMRWDVDALDGTPFNRLVFTLMDASDTGAFLRIISGDDTLEVRTGGRLANGNTQVIEINFDSLVDSAEVILGNFRTSGGTRQRRNDGFAVDGFQVAAVPLPASVLLLGGALAGFGAMRRKADKKA